MGITIADQTITFLYALLLGAALGVLYDVFRILRVAFTPGRIAAFLEDLLFGLSAGVLTVFFLIAQTYGEIRIFALLGEAIGFLLYHLTIGVLVLRASRWIIGLVKRILLFLYRITLAPIFALFGRVWIIIKNLAQKSGVSMKKSLRRRKFRLKRSRVLLYNLLIRRKARAHPKKGAFEQHENTR